MLHFPEVQKIFFLIQKVLLVLFIVSAVLTIKTPIFIGSSLLVSGISVPWQSDFLYLSEVFLIFFLCFGIKDSVLFFTTLGKSVQKSFFALFLLLIGIIGSFFLADISSLHLLKSRYFVEMTMLCIVLYQQKAFQKIILSSFVCVGFLESILAIAQFFHNGSVEIPFLYETHFSSTTITSAKIHLFSHVQARAYGTFEHPNILAMYLLLSLGSLLALGKNYIYKKYSYLFYGIFFILSLGILSAFSKTAFAVLASCMGLHMISILLKNTLITRMHLLIAALSFILFIVIFLFAFIIFFNDPSTLFDRVLYSKIAIGQIVKSPLGSGLGSFTTHLFSYQEQLFPWEFQPVHNMFLLLGVETGIFSLLGGIGLFFTPSQKILKSFLAHISSYSLSIFYFTLFYFALTDHFYLTSYVGMISFTLFLFITSTKKFE